MSDREKDSFILAARLFYFGMKELRDEYALPLRKDMSQASKVTSRSRPGDLLDLVVATTGTDALSHRRRFETLRKFDVTLMLAEIERRDPQLSVDDDIHAMLDLMEGKLFIGSKQIVVWSYHAMLNKMHVEHIRVGYECRLDTLTMSDPQNPLIERMHDLPHTQLANGSYCFLDERGKGTFRTWLKMLRQLSDPKKQDRFDVILDRRGIKQVFSDSEHLYEAVELNRSMIEGDGGSFIVRHDNVTRDGVKDSNNGESDSKYFALDAEVEVAGTIFELVFQTFADFYSSELAVDDVSHGLYTQRQAFKDFFKVLWPQRIYKTDWSDPNLFRALRSWKSGNVRFGNGWRDPRSPTESGSSFPPVAD